MILRIGHLSLLRKLFLGFGMVTVLAMLIAGGGILALHGIHRNALHTNRDVDLRIQEQIALSEYVAHIRETSDHIVQAQDLSQLTQAESSLTELPAIDSYSSYQTKFSHLQEVVHSLAEAKRLYLADSIRLDQQDQTLTAELEKTVAEIETLIVTISSEALSKAKGTISGVYEDVVSEANSVSHQYAQMAQQADTTIVSISTVYTLRSYIHELRALMNRMLLVHDADLVNYLQNSYDTITQNIAGTLTKLGSSETTAQLESRIQLITQLTPAFIALRKQEIQGGASALDTDTEINSVQTKIEDIIREIDAIVALMVDNISFDSVVSFENVADTGQARAATNAQNLYQNFTEVTLAMEHCLQITQSARQATTATYALGINIKDMLRCQNADLLNDFGKQSETLLTDIRTQITTMDDPNGSDRLLFSVQRMQEMTLRLIEGRGTALREQQQLAQNLDDLIHTLEKANQSIRAKTGSLRDDINFQLATNSMLVKRWSSIIVVLSLVLLGITLCIAIRLPQSISRPLRSVLGHLRTVSEGNLTRELAVDRHDEIGILAQHINDMVANLRSILCRMHEMAHQITEVGNELDHNSAQQVLGISDQSAAVTQTSAAAIELSTTSEHIGNNIQSVSETTRTALDGMDGIRTTSEKVNTLLHDLHARSAEIRGITHIINDVADKTNLLAVNAAIEAARAGEHGRGFAIVADQIGKLADSTAQSTKEISSIVDLINHDMSDVLKAMDHNLDDICHEMELAGDSATRAKEISQGVQEQVQGTRQISDAMRNIDQTMSQIADTADSTAQAAGRLSSLADDLKDTMAHFTIDSESETSC